MFRQVWDSVANIVTGMGTAKAKSVSTVYSFVPISPQELEAAYRGSWLARKVVDVPALDMCREWRDWQAEDAEIEAIEAEEKRLNLQGKVLEAKIKARLYGGAAILIGDATDNQAEELRPERLGKGGIKYLPVLTWQFISAGEIERDVTSPWHGLPKFYRLHSDRAGQLEVHPSRVVRFLGAPLPNADHAANVAWGDSVLEAVDRALKDAESAASNVAELTHEAKVDVLRVPNLMQLASDPEYEARFQRRASLAMMSKSINNTLLLDKEEEYEAKQINFGTLPDVIDRFMQIAAGAADIPVTRLLGQSPGGLQSTGKGEEKDYFNRIRSMQELELRPSLSMLDECLIWSALGRRPKEIHYTWSPLFVLDEKDQAEITLKKAQAFQIDVNSGAFMQEELRKMRSNQLVEDSVYPGLEGVMAETEEGGGFDLGSGEDLPSNVTPLRTGTTDAEPRTLYVHRKVKNAADIIAWAKDQGLETTLPADDLHVTIAYSRAPVDWMKIGESWSSEMTVAAGGPRLMERFGEATVLLFKASELEWRHDAMERAGASWDHPEYQPHITISYAAAGLDLTKVTPYQGEIVLGPEIFEEVREDWQGGIEER